MVMKSLIRVIKDGETYVENPITDRLVKENSALGKKIVKKLGGVVIGTGNINVATDYKLEVDRIGSNGWRIQHYYKRVPKSEQPTLSKLLSTVYKLIKPNMTNINLTLVAEDPWGYKLYRSFKVPPLEDFNKLLNEILNSRYSNITAEGTQSGSDVLLREYEYVSTFFRLSFKDKNDGYSGRKDLLTQKTEYFKTISPKSDHGDCLLALLVMGRKIKTKTVREELSLGKNTGISLDQIDMLEDYFKVNIHVYADEVKIVQEKIDNNSINKTTTSYEHILERESKLKYNETINVLLKDKHYSLIVEKFPLHFDPICGDRLKIKKGELQKMKKLQIKKSLMRQGRKIAGEKENQEYETRILTYDIETIFDPKDLNILRPYSVAWSVRKSSEIKVNLFNEQNIEGYMNETHIKYGENCMKEFVDWIEKNDNGIKFIVIGYNSSRFDNFALLKELINSDSYTSMLYVQNSILSLNFGGKHKCWDLCRFINTSLDKACESFNVFPKKLKGFDHKIPQEEFMKGGWTSLNKWISDNEKNLRLYNKTDVLSTESLFFKVGKAYKKLTGAMITDFTTLASLSYDVFKKSITSFENGKPKPIYDIPAPKNLEDDNRIRSAIVGGRCQVFTTTKHNIHDRIFCIDVKSLYPYIMLNRHFPIGEYYETDKYIPGKLGIYSVKITKQPKIKIIPYRNEGILDWEYEGEINHHCTSVEIECLKRHGAEFQFTNWDEDGHIGIYWKNSSDKLYTKYFQPIKDEKTKQDNLKKAEENNKSKETDEKYNPALREISKLLLNSLSGKKVQRNFTSVTTLVKNIKEENKLAEKTKSLECKMIIGPYKLLEGELKEEKVYSRRKAKPSYIGVFIYAHSRTYMYECVYSKYNCIYTDTDSAFLNESDYNDLKSKYINQVGDGPLKYYETSSKQSPIKTLGGEFGQFEEELKSEGKNCESYFLAKKLYCVQITSDKVENGVTKKIVHKESKYRMKGVNKNDARLSSFNMSIIRRFIKEDKLAKTDISKSLVSEMRTRFLFELKNKLDEINRNNKDDDKNIQHFRDLYKDGEINYLCSQIKKTKGLEHNVPVSLQNVFTIKNIKVSDLITETEINY